MAVGHVATHGEREPLAGAETTGTLRYWREGGEQARGTNTRVEEGERTDKDSTSTYGSRQNRT